MIVDLRDYTTTPGARDRLIERCEARLFDEPVRPGAPRSPGAAAGSAPQEPGSPTCCRTGSRSRVVIRGSSRGDLAIGFAFVGEAPFPHMTPGVRFRLCELFVQRGERRSGAARAAVRAIVARSPGSFELSVLHENAPALRFWRAVLPEHAGASLRATPTDGRVLFSFTT